MNSDDKKDIKTLANLTKSTTSVQGLTEASNIMKSFIALLAIVAVAAAKPEAM